MMQFPNNVEEFMEQYKIIDTEQVYTNGIELVPIFRMKQWFDHIEGIPSTERRGRWISDFNGKFSGGAYWFHCSHCKRIVPDIRNGGWNYCPNCGSKMERE